MMNPFAARVRGGMIAATASAFLLAGCGSAEVEHSYPEKLAKSGEVIYTGKQRETVFGSGGLDIFGNSKRDQGGGGAPGVAVNSFLWRASLDTISFMPLASADPFGGVIITDWYVLPEMPAERFKMNIYILDRQLRSDGVRVSVFRQSRGREGDWVDLDMKSETATNLENQILTRARQLRLSATSGAR